MGLADNIRKYEDKGRDGQEIIDRLVRSGDLPGPVKHNTDDRRAMQRHPLDYDENELKEAGVWDQPALGEYKGATVGEVYEGASEEEGDEEEEDEDEDDEEEWDENEERGFATD